MIESIAEHLFNCIDLQKTLNAQLKELRLKKKELETELISALVENNLESYKTQNGKKLQLVNSNQLGPLNKEYIEECLTDFFNSAEKRDALSCTEFLISKRPVKAELKLKISKK
jgi:hypothetical protein